MEKKIYVEVEQYDNKDGGFMTIALKGNTYEAKDIIKANGNFSFSNMIGYGKAWRLEPFTKSEMVKNAEQIKNAWQSCVADLQNAGYEVSRR